MRMQTVDDTIVIFHQHHMLSCMSVLYEDMATVWSAQHKVITPKTRLFGLKKYRKSMCNQEHLRCFKTENLNGTNFTFFFLQNTAWCVVSYNQKYLREVNMIKYENIYMKNIKMKWLALPLSLSYGGLHRSFLQQVWYRVPRPSLSTLSFSGKSPGSYQKDEEDYIQTRYIQIYHILCVFVCECT